MLEASAGTGKTFALAGLVTRLVAEGAATLDEMLLITFGRAASQELRERVRGQIVDALAGFRRSVARPTTIWSRHLIAEDRQTPRHAAAARRAGRASMPPPSRPPTSSARSC